MINPIFLEKISQFRLLRAKLKHVFNRDADFIFDSIYEEATYLPIDTAIYIEKEMNFEIETKLAMAEITDTLVLDSVLKDYEFLELMANGAVEFRVALNISPRSMAIVRSIFDFRRYRNRNESRSMPKISFWGVSVIEPKNMLEGFK